MVVGGVTIAPDAGAAIVDQDFAFTGAAQSYQVPAGICSVSIVAIGASGGQWTPNSHELEGQAGLGGMVSARVPVTPGSSLTVLVGGQGAPGMGGAAPSVPPAAGGFNGGGNGGEAEAPRAFNAGGGGGGGASSVMVGSTPLVVAGGGGGIGGAVFANPSDGGDKGGNAGFPSAQPGSAGFTLPPFGTPGGGGTQTTGGAGGLNQGGSGTGQAGVASRGGDGGGGSAYASGGGGGGGGWFGGGGGGAGLVTGFGRDTVPASGGGGGSSFGPSNASFVVYPTYGDGSVSIFFDPATDACPTTSTTTATTGATSSTTNGTTSATTSAGTPSAVEVVPKFTG
jgi:hypothetical protein